MPVRDAAANLSASRRTLLAGVAGAAASCALTVPAYPLLPLGQKHPVIANPNPEGLL